MYIIPVAFEVRVYCSKIGFVEKVMFRQQLIKQNETWNIKIPFPRMTPDLNISIIIEKTHHRRKFLVDLVFFQTFEFLPYEVMPIQPVCYALLSVRTGSYTP